MRRFLCTLVTLLWGLWFGGLATLFVAVVSIFSALPDHRTLAGQAAARVFESFNSYQMVLAAASLLAVFLWYVTGPPRLKIALFAILLTATCAAGLVTFYISPHIVWLDQHHLTQTRQFARFHGAAMIVYLIETLTLLIGGIVLSRARQ